MRGERNGDDNDEESESEEDPENEKNREGAIGTVSSGRAVDEETDVHDYVCMVFVELFHRRLLPAIHSLRLTPGKHVLPFHSYMRM